MPKDAPDIRKRELAQIHIAKAQLGLDDETYRNVLWTVARERSAADLDFSGRKAVLDHFKARGFKARPANKSNTTRPLSDAPQHKMIRGLWLELYGMGVILDPSEQAIQRFIKNQTKPRVDRMEWLTSKQASDLIELLKGWRAREIKKAVANG